MKRNNFSTRSGFRFFVTAVLIFGVPLTMKAQETMPVPVPVAAPQPIEAPTHNTLSAILHARDYIDEELATLNEELAGATSDALKKEIGERVSQFMRQRQELTRDLEKIATGIDLASIAEQQKKSFNIQEEIKDLLTPVIQELKALTETPRAIEKLRREVAFYQENLETIQKAMGNIQSLIKGTNDPGVKLNLEEMEKRWLSRQRQVANQLAVATFQLEEKTKTRTNFLDTSRHFFQVFFKSRGRNLIVAMLSFAAVFFLMRLIFRAIMKSQKKSVSTLRSFYFKLFNISYYFFTFIFSFAAFMTALYVSGDWLLLSIAIIFVLGLLWTAKEGLPRFSEQIKFMLNLGTVKENERLIYNGVPWLVVSLNLYSLLENPALSSGRIRLPIKHLTDMVSRPNPPDEPWFPSKCGDWVILSDQTHGKVIVQTPETVVLELRGGAVKNYQTPVFLKMNPMNISTQFRLEIAFGLDYAHRQIATTDVPRQLTDSIRASLNQDGYGNLLKQLSVDFQTVSASSLEYVIIADFDGEAASLYDRLSRVMQRYAVDAANQFGWKIPFTHLSLHHINQ